MEDFLKLLVNVLVTIFKIKGSLAGRDIIISIGPSEDNNYVSTKCATQLVIPE